jgi:acetyltransferase-like isoleucine patch superfamily enzyme
MQVEVGRDCFLSKGIGVAAEGGAGSLRLGDRVQINRNVHLDMTGGLTLGDDVLISEGAVLYTHDHGLDPRSVPTFGPKTIGPGAWIGMRAIVLPGCQHVGAAAIIGAGAVVTRDVPAGAIIAGNPARIIGQRQPKEIAA